jgi:hypothetical protein
MSIASSVILASTLAVSATSCVEKVLLLRQVSCCARRVFLRNKVSQMALVDQVSSSAELDDLLEKCIKVANYSKARRLI